MSQKLGLRFNWNVLYYEAEYFSNDGIRMTQQFSLLGRPYTTFRALSVTPSSGDWL
jgi:hypothetical protein